MCERNYKLQIVIYYLLLRLFKYGLLKIYSEVQRYIQENKLMKKMFSTSLPVVIFLSKISVKTILFLMLIKKSYCGPPKKRSKSRNSNLTLCLGCPRKR